MEFRSLRPGELDAWASHCALVFGLEGHGVDREYFLRHYHDDPWRDLNGILVAVDGDTIASTVRVFRRKVWLFGQEVLMGGIGEVSTNPDYRGRGLAGKLLELSVDWMIGEGLAVSVLYSGLHDFYRRYGWDVIPKNNALFQDDGTAPCEGRRMEPGDLAALGIVDAAAERSNWRVIRGGGEYWERWMRSAIGPCVVATESDGVVAWLAYRLEDSTWSVADFRALPGYEGRFGSLCRLAAELEGRRGQQFIAPAWLAVGEQPADIMELDYSMVRLNTPITAAGKTISTTLELIEASREYRDSSLDHF